MSPGTFSRGEVSAETVTVFGALMILVFLVIGTASFAVSAHVAAVGSLQAARAGAVTRGETRDIFVVAVNRAETVVRELGSQLAGPPRVQVTIKYLSVTVSVKTRAPLGFLPQTVTRSATVPLEVYLGEAER